MVRVVVVWFVVVFAVDGVIWSWLLRCVVWWPSVGAFVMYWCCVGWCDAPCASTWCVVVRVVGVVVS